MSTFEVSLPPALRLLKTLCARFDSAGESQRSKRARLAESAFQLLHTKNENVEALEVEDTRQFLEKLPASKVALIKPDRSAKSLSALSNQGLALLLLTEQHKDMNDDDYYRYEVSLGIQKLLITKHTLIMFRMLGLSGYSREQMLAEAMSRV